MTPTHYDIVATHCYPSSWRLVPVGNYRIDNATCNFFRTIEAALDEIIHRGADIRGVYQLGQHPKVG